MTTVVVTSSVVVGGAAVVGTSVVVSRVVITSVVVGAPLKKNINPCLKLHTSTWRLHAVI